MWEDLTTIVASVLNITGRAFALYSTEGILSIVLVIWIVRRVLKSFNIL